MEALVRLAFASPNDLEKGGEIVLLGDNTLFFVPSDKLLHEMDALESRAGELSLKWGTSLVVGLTAIGAALFVKDRKAWAGTLFGLAGASGAIAYGAKNYAHRLAHFLHTPQKLADVRVSLEPSGDLSFATTAKGLQKITVAISADEFDASDADAFVRAVSQAQNGG